LQQFLEERKLREEKNADMDVVNQKFLIHGVEEKA